MSLNEKGDLGEGVAAGRNSSTHSFYLGLAVPHFLDRTDHLAYGSLSSPKSECR
jgi:hypothetical protein